MFTEHGECIWHSFWKFYELDIANSEKVIKRAVLATDSNESYYLTYDCKQKKRAGQWYHVPNVYYTSYSKKADKGKVEALIREHMPALAFRPLNQYD